MTAPHVRAVIFDIGGVVLRSPFIAIATHERELGVPENYINCSIVERGAQGAWQKFERGEMSLFDFYEAFGHELSDTVNGNIWYKAYCDRNGLEVPPLPETLNISGRDLFGSMMRGSNVYDPHILHAIHRIRATGRYKTIALTNNFAKAKVPPVEAQFLGWDEGATPDHLRSLFDDFCDSSTLGMRKPEPEFYLLACERNGIQPWQAIFLDDIKINLKSAKMLGMETIHVSIGKTLDAVKILEGKLGIDLTGSLEHVTSKL